VGRAAADAQRFVKVDVDLTGVHFVTWSCASMQKPRGVLGAVKLDVESQGWLPARVPPTPTQELDAHDMAAKALQQQAAAASATPQETAPADFTTKLQKLVQTLVSLLTSN